MIQNLSTAKTRPFRETAWVVELFDYPETETARDPETKIEQGIIVGGAGSTGYDGASGQNYSALYLPYGQYGGYWHYRRYAGGAYSDHYLFFNEDEWRLGVAADPPDEDFAYYSTNGLNGAWSVGTGSSPAPVVQVGGIGTAGKSSGKGWSGAWVRDGQVWDFGLLEGPEAPYTKDSVDLKSGRTMGFCPKSPSAWPDAGVYRLIDLTKIPSQYRKGGTGNLGEYGTTVWFAYTIQLDNAVESGRWAGMKPAATNGWFGRNYNASNWGMEAGWTVTQQNSSVAITADVMHFLVQKNTWVYVDGGSGDYCETSLWVDPTPALHPSASGPVESADLSAVKMKYWTTDRMYVNISNNGKFGNLRIGPTYFSVAPGQLGLPS